MRKLGSQPEQSQSNAEINNIEKCNQVTRHHMHEMIYNGLPKKLNSFFFVPFHHIIAYRNWVSAHTCGNNLFIFNRL